MPLGMFLLIHDEVLGPEIKCSYYAKPVNLSQEFISKLYMSHAGFESSSHIEIKFEDFKSISCFTGNLARRTQKEGIMGIIFEEDDEFDNLDLFLQRNLDEVIQNPKDETLQKIFSQKLPNYLKLSNLFQKVDIEGFPEIFLITGNNEFKSRLLSISESSIPLSKMNDFYKKIVKNQKIPQYQYIKLDLENGYNSFIVLRNKGSSEDNKNMLETLKFYLEKNIYYSLEILALLLLATVIRITDFKKDLSKKDLNKTRTVLQRLQQSNDYYNEFNNIILDLIKGNIVILPSL
ncbi:MAG: hypothetical protein EAX91_00380 [Candidatus Lokiarchaeota archaeon]|nr:hypothetical protein [Candidatus Lokiarchaeota archaeon]